MSDRHTRLAATILAVVAGTLGLAGCGGSAAAADRIPTIVLTAHFSKYTPAGFHAAPGTTVRIVVHNLDPIAHELIIGDAGVHERHEKGTEAYHPPHPGEVTIPADSTQSTTFTFGTVIGRPFEFGCHLPGHWAYGMRGVATVA